MRGRLSLVLMFVFVALLVPAGAAFAIEMEYHTFGGFDAVVNAFEKLALIFSDNSYRALIGAVVVISIFFGGATFYFRAYMSGRGGVGFTWVVPILLGVVIYLAAVKETGTLHIYDPVLNRYQPVSGVPALIVGAAGMLSMIENGLVEIIDTAGDPLSYKDHAGGAGFMGLYNLSINSLLASDPYKEASLQKYIEDCVSFELQRPGSNLTVEELRRSSTDLKASLGKANSPAIYTLYFSGADPQGTAMTCAGAWAQINTDISTVGQLDHNLYGLCASQGFNPNDPVSFNRCKAAIEDAVKHAGWGSITADNFFRQKFLAEQLDKVYRDGNVTATASFGMMTAASGAMIQANEYFPYLRGVLTAIAVGIIPFVALFIASPLFGRGLGLILAFFVWLTAWGVADATIHGFMMDFAQRQMASLYQTGGGAGGMGMDVFMLFPDANAKTLALFGTMRSSGLMLATIITGMLIKFGGHALAQLSGSVMGQIQGAGAQAAGAMESPTQRAAAVKSGWGAMQTLDLANTERYGYSAQSEAVKQDVMRKPIGAEAQNMMRESLAGQGVSEARDMGDFMRAQALGSKQLSSMNLVGRGQGSVGVTSDGKVIAAQFGGGFNDKGQTRHGFSRDQKMDAFDGGSGSVSLAHGDGMRATIRHDEGHGVDITEARVNGLGVGITNSYQETASREAGRALAHEETLNRVLSESDKSGVVLSSGNTFREEFSNNISEEAAKAVKDVAGLDMFKNEETQKKLSAFAGASGSWGDGGIAGFLTGLFGGKFKVEAGVKGEAAAIGADGTKVSFNASTEEVEALRRVASHARSNAMATTLQNSEAREHVMNLGEGVVGKNGMSYLEKAQAADSMGHDQKLGLETGFVKDYVHRHSGGKLYNEDGSVNEDVLQQGMLRLNQIVAGQDAGAQARLFEEMNNFNRTRFDAVDDPQYSHGNTVLSDIGSIRNTIIGNNGALGEQTSAAAERAESAVDGHDFDVDVFDPTITAPSEDVEKKAAGRNRAMIGTYEEDGSSSFTSNPVKGLARKAASPFIPQPDKADPRSFAGSPGSTLGKSVAAPEGWTGNPDDLPQGTGTSTNNVSDGQPLDFGSPVEVLQRQTQRTADSIKGTLGSVLPDISPEANAERARKIGGAVRAVTPDNSPEANAERANIAGSMVSAVTPDNSPEANDLRTRQIAGSVDRMVGGRDIPSATPAANEDTNPSERRARTAESMVEAVTPDNSPEASNLRARQIAGSVDRMVGGKGRTAPNGQQADAPAQNQIIQPWETMSAHDSGGQGNGGAGSQQPGVPGQGTVSQTPVTGSQQTGRLDTMNTHTSKDEQFPSEQQFQSAQTPTIKAEDLNAGRISYGEMQGFLDNAWAQESRHLESGVVNEKLNDQAATQNAQVLPAQQKPVMQAASNGKGKSGVSEDEKQEEEYYIPKDDPVNSDDHRSAEIVNQDPRGWMRKKG